MLHLITHKNSHDTANIYRDKQGCTEFRLRLRQIRNSAIFPKFGKIRLRPNFWPNLADANATAVRSVSYLIMDKTKEADLSSDVFAIFIIFLHVNYSILINIIKLLKPSVHTVLGANFVFFYLVCVKVGMAHVEFRKVRNLRK